jgi:hypothetical protein
VQPLTAPGPPSGVQELDDVLGSEDVV